jgi:curved DNA-binding protein CbpA
MTDYYEFLQISPNADADTIHRVYRFLAARLHPDNPATGNAEMFHLVKVAYDVLADPVARAEYDVSRKRKGPEEAPLSNSVDFMDSIDGELNRRLAVLAVLYYRRRTSPHLPEVSLGEIEEKMGFPRDYLDFTLWYLSKKGYISKGDNAQFILTADGVDFVESQRSHLPVLNNLLTSGNTSAATTPETERANKPRRATDRAHQAVVASKPIVLPSSMDLEPERRMNKTERRNATTNRRVGRPDHRINKVERRVNRNDRRANSGDRREKDPEQRTKSNGRRATD